MTRQLTKEFSARRRSQPTTTSLDSLTEPGTDVLRLVWRGAVVLADESGLVGA